VALLREHDLVAVTVRLPRPLANGLRIEAARQGVTVQALVTRALSRARIQATQEAPPKLSPGPRPRRR
jgi:hypothetical protein